MLYIKRIFLAFIMAGIFLMGLETYTYYQYRYINYDELIYNVGIISEEAPEYMNAIVSRMANSNEDESVYENGLAALRSLGYGEKGRKYYINNSSYGTSFFIMLSCIAVTFFVLGFYVLSFIKRLKHIGKNLVYSMEHAITKYPFKLDEVLTDIPAVNKVYHQSSVLVERLNHQIELMKLAQADRTVFIENISHQIKTPLTCISLDLELLSNLKDQNRAELYINSCYTQIDHIEALVNRLLKIGKLESGKVHYEFFEHNLLDTIHVLCNKLDAQYPEKKVNLLYNEQEDYTLLYDIVWLYEALENIAKNCYLYSYDQRGITIELVHYENYIKIILSDQGIGIPPRDLPNIFDRFYRSEQTKNQEGFGIGLNLAKLVIEGHHGTIFAKSDNHSTQFIIHLPLIQ